MGDIVLNKSVVGLVKGKPSGCTGLNI